MSQTLLAQQIERLILHEFARLNDENPLQNRYQALLIEAHGRADVRGMAVVLEYAGDYFSRSGSAVQEAVRMYQAAIFCLGHSAEEAALSDLVYGLDYNQKEYRGADEGRNLTPDLFQLDHREGVPDPAQAADPELAIRLLFKAGAAMSLQGQTGRAIDFYDKALTLGRARTAASEALRARVLANRGVVLRIKDQLPEARENLDEALKIFHRLGLRHEEAKTVSMLAGIERAHGQLAEAARLYRRALALYERSGVPDRRGLARTCTGAGLLYLEKKNYQRALAFFEAAGRHADGLPIPDLHWPIHWGLACYYLAKKAYDPAEENLARCIGHIETFQDDLCSDEGKATFIESVQFVYGKNFEVLTGSPRKFKTSLAALLDLMERSRAQALQDLFPGNAPKAFIYGADTANLPMMQQPITAQMPNMAMPFGEPSDADEAIRQRLRALEERPAEEPALPATAPRRLVFKVLPRHTVMLVVDDNTNTIEGRLLRKDASAWRHDLETFRAVIGHERFGRRDIADWDDTAAPPPVADAGAALFRKLYRELLHPVRKLLPEGELLIVEPDGPLWQLPLHLLALPDGRVAADVWPMVYAPSFEAYRQFRTAPVLPIAPDDWFLFAGLGQPHRIGEQTFDALAFAEREVESVAKNILGVADQHILLGDACTEPATRGHLPGSRIVHLAAHGKAESQDPASSYVALLGDTLSAADVRQLELPHCELVVLSACQSGLGKVMSEGMVGLARAFQLAGARSLLVSLWSVEDESTQLLMEHFYRQLKANGGHKARALQAAMQAVRRLPGKDAPRCWAPFVLIGVEDCVFRDRVNRILQD